MSKIFALQVFCDEDEVFGVNFGEARMREHPYTRVVEFKMVDTGARVFKVRPVPDMFLL